MGWDIGWAAGYLRGGGQVRRKSWDEDVFIEIEDYQIRQHSPVRSVGYIYIPSIEDLEARDWETFIFIAPCFNCGEKAVRKELGIECTNCATRIFSTAMWNEVAKMMEKE